MKRTAVSLLELVAVVTLLGIVAAVIMLRLRGDEKDVVKKDACAVIKGEIELQSRLWYRTRNIWPSPDLSDIGADRTYFLKGLPKCPVDNSAYELDPTTHRVNGHTH